MKIKTPLQFLNNRKLDRFFCEYVNYLNKKIKSIGMKSKLQAMKIFEEEFLVVVDEMIPLFEVALIDEDIQVNEFRFQEYSEKEFIRFDAWFRTEAMFYILSKAESLKADEVKFSKLRQYREKYAFT